MCAPLVLGCDGDPSAPSGDPIDCGADVSAVDVSVSTGSSLVFDWSPRCRVALLLVEEGPSDRWALGDAESNLVGPPVTYGVVPDGIEGDAAQSLTDGTEYDLVVWIVDGASARLVANHQFLR